MKCRYCKEPFTNIYVHYLNSHPGVVSKLITEHNLEWSENRMTLNPKCTPLYQEAVINISTAAGWITMDRIEYHKKIAQKYKVLKEVLRRLDTIQHKYINSTTWKCEKCHTIICKDCVDTHNCEVK